MTHQSLGKVNSQSGYSKFFKLINFNESISYNFLSCTEFNDNEIILRLHDEGKEGRLFKMETW